MSDLAPLLAGVRPAVFDFDGVFTDNRVWTNERGEESVACSRSDGHGCVREQCDAISSARRSEAAA